MRKVSAKIGDSRVYFVEGTENREGMVLVYTATTNVGWYRTDRFGDKLGRAWVRAFAEASGQEAVF